jgi:hypothetical protein
MRPLPYDGMRQVRAGIRNPSQTQRSRDGIGMAGLSQHADSMLAAPVVGEAPRTDFAPKLVCAAILQMPLARIHRAAHLPLKQKGRLAATVPGLPLIRFSRSARWAP